MKKDNSTLPDKVRIRHHVRSLLDGVPVVLETHGGYGEIWQRVWADCPGAVLEKKEDRAFYLAEQRPTWPVYCGDSAALLGAGLLSWMSPTVLDVDPHGSPWGAIRGFFSSDRDFAPRMVVVVNDGLRQQSISRGGAWRYEELAPIVEKFGPSLYRKYLTACRYMMDLQVKAAGYAIADFAGYYTGFNHGLTHYYAALERSR